ncbi:UNVERIFIED_CONTAM: hypothetical protein Scaly_2480300, partial [Sesamum calycinum]
MVSPTKQENRGKKVEADCDHLKIQTSDNPGTVLVSNLLDSTNFLSWSCSIKVTLRAKMKLGFINGKIVKPDEEDEEFEQWERADGIRNQILIMEPLPNVSKAYAIVLRVERQREDHTINKTVAVGKLVGKLYVLDKRSFEVHTTRHKEKQLQEIGLTVSSVNVNLWHKRFGHISANVMKHLKFKKDNKTAFDI